MVRKCMNPSPHRFEVSMVRLQFMTTNDHIPKVSLSSDARTGGFVALLLNRLPININRLLTQESAHAPIL